MFYVFMCGKKKLISYIIANLDHWPMKKKTTINCLSMIVIYNL